MRRVTETRHLQQLHR